MRMIAVAMTAQNADSGARRMRPHKPWRPRRVGAAAMVGAAIGSTSGSRTVIDPGSLVADSGIEPSDRHVDGNVQHDENNRVEKHQVLHHKDVAFGDRGEHRVAETGRAEGALDRD